MEFHIGWPEGIYLAINILSAAYLGAIQGARKAVAYVVAWLFLTMPLLIWGGFFA